MLEHLKRHSSSRRGFMRGHPFFKESCFGRGNRYQIVVGLGGDVAPEIGDQFELLVSGKLLHNGKIGEFHADRKLAALAFEAKGEGFPGKSAFLSLARIPIPPIFISMERDCGQRKPLTGRINRIAGQVQGIGRMIGENRDCPEILHTISAVHAALRGLEAALLEDHVRHCVAEAAADPGQLDRRLEELVTLYKRRLA
jgi:DNA-binding FrmR family transcriptional regulator